MINFTEIFNNINYIFILFCYIVTKIYSLAIEFRVFLQIFFTINPYNYPLRLMWIWTNPVFTVGRKLYPYFITIDICPIVNLMLLKKLSAFLHIFLVKYKTQSKILSNLITNSLSFNYKKKALIILKRYILNYVR